MNRSEYSNLQEELQAEGYIRHWNHTDAETVHEIATEYGCTECGDSTVLYIGWKKGDSYRAFACCEHCGYVEEF